jgi:hypothetical protein
LELSNDVDIRAAALIAPEGDRADTRFADDVFFAVPRRSRRTYPPNVKLTNDRMSRRMLRAHYLRLSTSWRSHHGLLVAHHGDSLIILELNIFELAPSCPAQDGRTSMPRQQTLVRFHNSTVSNSGKALTTGVPTVAIRLHRLAG